MTKRLAMIIGCVAVLSAAAAAQPSTRTCSFVGQIPASDGSATESSAPDADIVVAADLDGELTGYFTFVVTRSANWVTGSWLWTKKQADADGNLESVGMLEGTITGGSAVLSDDGRVTAVKDVVLSVESGSGELKSVTAGSGTLNGTFDPQAPRTFKGTLTFTY